MLLIIHNSLSKFCVLVLVACSGWSLWCGWSLWWVWHVSGMTHCWFMMMKFILIVTVDISLTMVGVILVIEFLITVIIVR